MTPEEYEHHVAEVLRSEGWAATVTSYAGDEGIDIIAERDGVRQAVQVKLYGSSRRVNAAQIRELVGAAQYADCSSAMLVTDGELLDTAWDTARKLGVEVRRVLPTTRADTTSSPAPEVVPPSSRGEDLTFGAIWTDLITPLAGRTIETRSRGQSNHILRVDQGGLTRQTSSGSIQKIEIEIFRWTIEKLLAGETVSRDEINDQYPKRASSGVLAVLCALPIFEQVAVGRGVGVRIRQGGAS